MILGRRDRHTIIVMAGHCRYSRAVPVTRQGRWRMLQSICADCILSELYTDESPGLKVDPVIVLVLSLGFIFSVVALHG